jgi:uncharacterized protein YjiS (DUF1127 family)
MSRSSVLESHRAHSRAGTGRRIWSGWADTMASWLMRHQVRQDLSALDDRLLEDLGISREDALWQARKPFWRP